MIDNRYRQYMYSYPHKTAYYPVEKGTVVAHLKNLEGQTAGLYLHIPFCRSKCGYCNLFSVAGPDEDLITQYIEAVSRQIRQINNVIPLPSIRFDSLVLGGGTPTLLTVKQLDSLLEKLSAVTGISPDSTQSVIELSPSCTTAEMTAYLEAQGFQRVSLGIQSFVPQELEALGRLENPTATHSALERLRVRFPVCNLDLIYGIPGQTEETLLYSLEAALRYHPEELFLYPLYARKGTPLEGAALDEAHLAVLYRTGRDKLLEHGYRQLSMRRFTRKQVANGDCGFEQCLSLGCGGRSYLGPLHVCEPYAVAPQRCRESLLGFVGKEDFLTGLHGYLLNQEEQKRRYVIKNLLHVDGVRPQNYQEHFSASLEEDFPLIAQLVEKGFAYKIDGSICLTDQGLSYSDTIGPLLISDAVLKRTEQFQEYTL